MSHVLEIVNFRLKAESDEQAFLAASAAMEQSFAREQPGFIERVLGRGEGGEWVDVVQWTSPAAADDAAAAELESAACRPFFSMIDEPSIRLSRFEITSLAAAAVDR